MSLQEAAQLLRELDTTPEPRAHGGSMLLVSVAGGYGTPHMAKTLNAIRTLYEAASPSSPYPPFPPSPYGDVA